MGLLFSSICLTNSKKGQIVEEKNEKKEIGERKLVPLFFSILIKISNLKSQKRLVLVFDCLLFVFEIVP